MLDTSVQQDAFMLGYLFGKYGLILFLWIATAPLFWVIRRAGISRWWSILLLIPFFGPLLVIWLIAISRWPALSRTT